MRTIKFQAWNKKYGVMKVYSIDLLTKRAVCEFQEDMSAPFRIDARAANDGGGMSCSLQVNTGLKDDLGNDVYEYFDL